MSDKIYLSIKYELEAANVKDEHIEFILERVKNRLTEENIDVELEKLGYEKIFTNDYNDSDYFDD